MVFGYNTDYGLRQYATLRLRQPRHRNAPSSEIQSSSASRSWTHEALSLATCTTSTQPIVLQLFIQSTRLFLRFVAALQADEHGDTLEHSSDCFRHFGRVHGLLAERSWGVAGWRVELVDCVCVVDGCVLRGDGREGTR